MQISARCPRCNEAILTDLPESNVEIRCSACEWSRDCSAEEIIDGAPSCCLVCGCNDVWKQKDFPQGLGMLLVGIGATLSTVAWAYMRPVLAIGILLGFALVDLLLFVFMRDVLVCYRCRTVHRRAQLDENHPRFDLETAERYRQEAMRLEEAKK